MQTFLPYKSFLQSAKVLDYKRLGKQRVEALQILMALLKVDKDLNPADKESHWLNHPAVKMWKGYEPALSFYLLIMCEEWLRRGFNSEMHHKVRKLWVDKFASLDFVEPEWLTEDFCRAHQSNLMRKDAKYYGVHFGEDMPDNLEYIWPVGKA